MLKVTNLYFDYPGKRALDNVTFTIEPNTITALVGPNGAGKTTLMRLMSALASPLTGNIEIDGHDVERYPRAVHSVCSYLSDFYGLYDRLSVTQCLTYFANSHNISENVPELVKTTAAKLQLTEYLDKQAQTLSRGLRQRLAIAQVIIHNPKILLLDEPASGLDPAARFHLSDLLRLLQKSGMTIIVSSHILAELKDYSTHMLVLNQGKMVKHCVLDDNTSMQDLYMEIFNDKPKKD